MATINEGILAGAFFLALFAITCAAVWFLAHFLRRWSRFPLPLSLVVSHTLLLLLCVALYPTGIFFGEPPVDDLYFGFFLFPGPHLYLLAGKLCIEPLTPFYSSLLDHMAPHTAALIGLVCFPALPCLILGGLQWYLIGKIVVWISIRPSRVPQI